MITSMKYVFFINIFFFSFSSLIFGSSGLNIENIHSLSVSFSSTLQFPHWSADGKQLFYFLPGSADEGAAFYCLEISSGESKVLFYIDNLLSRFSSLTSIAKKNRVETSDKPDDFIFSPDSQYVCFVFKGDIYEFEINTNKVKRVTYTPEPESCVKYSPDGRKISYVRSYNLFFTSREDNLEVPVTANGTRNVFYGTPDWVSSEELGLRDGYFWSPDSCHLAVLRFDESMVSSLPIVNHDVRPPQAILYKYPLAGDSNSLVTLHLFDIARKLLTPVPLGVDRYEYVARLNWANDSQHMFIQLLSRDQKHLLMMNFDRISGDTRLLLEEKDTRWVNVHDLFYLLKTRREFIWGAERDGFMHLYHYQLDGKLLNRITAGAWNVTGIDFVDEIDGRIYFTATEKSPLERHLYESPLPGGACRRITLQEGTHSVNFSPAGNFFIDCFHHELFPPVYSVLGVNSAKSPRILSAPSPQIMESLGLRAWDYTVLKLSSGDSLFARLLKPPDFDPSRKYPVIVYVYGGPGAQIVVRKWDGFIDLWHQYLSQQGFLIFCLDNRGGSGRGKTWETSIFGKLGDIELKDQLLGVEYLKSLPFVDPDRLGIWGWSYGGYLTLMALSSQPCPFRAGASVAPVTDWLNYDTIYTERYLSHPKDNASGYVASSPVHRLDRVQGALLLIHGESDENVHVQNSMQAVSRLVAAGKLFQLILYPGMNHDIASNQHRVHLCKSLLSFFEMNLK